MLFSSYFFGNWINTISGEFINQTWDKSLFQVCQISWVSWFFDIPNSHIHIFSSCILRSISSGEESFTSTRMIIHGSNMHVLTCKYLNRFNTLASTVIIPLYLVWINLNIRISHIIVSKGVFWDQSIILLVMYSNGGSQLNSINVVIEVTVESKSKQEHIFARNETDWLIICADIKLWWKFMCGESDKSSWSIWSSLTAFSSRE